MTEEVANSSALADLVAALADNKLFLGRRYAEWSSSAPALESAVAAAAMAQDEIGHARSLYPLLEDLAGSSEETQPETRVHFVNTPFLGESFRSWTDFVAANFLFDTALSVLLEAATDSSLGGLAQRARRMIEEERLHWLHGEGWTRRLAQEGKAVRDALSASFARIAPGTLAWFDTATDELVQRGVLAEAGTGLRDRYRARVNPVLEAEGLAPL
jgi:phenylacetate-CoA oxygenase PaaI subunit